MVNLYTRAEDKLLTATTNMKVKRFLNGDSWLESLSEASKIIAEAYGKESEKKDYEMKMSDINFTYPKDFLSNVKKVCVMFSGGCDSLSLALRHLEAGENVALCHIIFNEDETCAAYLTYKMLRKVYGERVLGFFKLFDPIYANNGEDTIGYCQQPIASFYASMIPRCLKDNCKAIESAYIINDDAISYIKELKAIYNNALAFKHMEKKVPYKFPLSKVKHFENIDFIKSIEEKYNIVFPTGSSVRPSLTAYRFSTKDGLESTLYAYSCRTDCKKENKVNETYGYIMFDGLIAAKDEEKLDSKVFK